MKLNAHTALSKPSILLVPYTPSQVPTYHTWMQNPANLSATASEPLSLTEEYAMQRSWREDGDKLTFVICLPLASDGSEKGGRRDVMGGVDDEAGRMVGDINLFLFEPDDDEDDENSSANDTNKRANVIGEIELMIANQSQQRKGYGRAALLAFLEFVLIHWREIAEEYRASLLLGEGVVPELHFLRVKVQQTNVGSLKLFEGVGFERTAEEANYFGELEMRWKPSLEGLRRLKGWERVDERVFVEAEKV